jgi:hypothetical protein
MRGTVDSYSTARGTRWRIRWDLPPDPETGERRRGQRRGFTTKREASKALTDELGRVHSGSCYVVPDKLTVKQWLEDEWLPSRKPRRGAARGHRGQLSLSTWSQYRTYIKAYVVPHIGHVALQQLSPADLNRLYDVPRTHRRTQRRRTGREDARERPWPRSQGAGRRGEARSGDAQRR